VTRDESSDSLAGTPIKQVAGGSYREEAQRLIDEQVALLFTTVEQAVTAQRGGRAEVRRSERSLAIGGAEAPIELAVEAITDVPADTDPARDFPQGEARCHVRVAGATVEEWVLSRTDQGSENPSYRWLHAEKGSPVTPADIRNLLSTV
jgi:hypothetical protein